MVGVFAHDGGSFKPAASIPVNNGGTWQNAQEVWANDNGVWVKVFPAEVREPATGELFAIFNTQWYHNYTYGGIYWQGVNIYAGYSITTSTMTYRVGSWTYYRGTSRGSATGADDFGIYRIGTP